MDRVLGNKIRTVLVGGRTFVLSELTIGAISEVVAGIKDRPLKDLARLKTEGLIDDQTYREAVKEELGRMRADKRDMGAVFDDAMHAGDLDAASRLFLGMARKHQPELKVEEVKELPIEELFNSLAVFNESDEKEAAGEGESKK